jgi:phage terminase large subunit GpA-like protein
MIFQGGLRTLRREIVAAAFTVFQPPPTLSVSQWADENRRLSATSAEPGQWRTSRVPYLKRIMDVLGDEVIRETVFAKSAQVGGSSCAENFLGYIIDQAPSAVLEVWPTEKALRAWSTKRLDPMLADTPCLKEKFPKSGRRDSKDSIASKEFPGGYIQALTAKSTADLRSHSSRVAIAEEVDEWEGDVGDQGDPLELLRARMRTFWNAKLYMVSTPTLAGFSRIWSELETSTWEEFWVPCPHCDHFQTLRWKDGDQDKYESGQYRLVWEKDDAGEPIPGTCCYVCENCSALIEERYKSWMLAEGFKRGGVDGWRPKFPGRAKVGFHINTIYSPLCQWDEIARAFTRALRRPTEMKTFVNTMLGLPYEESGDKVDSNFLSQRTESFPAEVPHGVGLLTAGVDVQADRLEALVYGYGAGERSWLIAREQFEGDPGGDEVWGELDTFLKSAFKHEGGALVRISAACIDAGYQTKNVVAFCEARTARKIIATVGRAGRGRKLIEAPDRREKFKRNRKKKALHVVGSDSGKDLLYSRLKLKIPGPGYIHFPESEDVDQVFFEQLTSETLRTKYTKGRPARVWELLPGRRNEALDLTILSIAALNYLGPKVIKELGKYAEILSKTPAPENAAPAVARPRGRRMISHGVDF